MRGLWLRCQSGINQPPVAPGPLWKTRNERCDTTDSVSVQQPFLCGAIKPVDSHLAEVHCGTEAVKL